MSDFRIFRFPAFWIFTGPYWTLQDPIGPYWTLLDPIGLYWTLLDLTGPYWTLLNPTGHLSSCPHGGRGKYFGRFFSCPHGGRGKYFGRFFSCPRGGRRKYFGRFLAVPMVVGENILESFLILGATGHGCSAEGTDAAPRAHGTGALQASEYERSSRRRYLTFVATAFSNVRRDGVL